MTNLNRRNALQLGAVALAAPAILTGGAARAQGVTQWRMQALWGGGTTPMLYEEKFCARVLELTGGTLEITPFSGGQIVPPAQAFDAVRGGAFQMMKTFDGYTAGKIPAHGFSSTVPFGFPEPDQYEAWFYERGGLDLARESYAAAGLTYVAPTVYGEEPIHSKVEIREIADLKGLKGRFVGLASAVMADFGVAVSPLPTSEVYSALDKGLIDVADRGDIKANYEEGIHEVAKYLILPGVHQPTTATSYIANTGAYEALDNQQKAALAVAAREVSGALRQDILVSNGEYLRKFADAGVEIIDFDPADVVQGRERAVESWAKAATDDLSKRMMESQMALMQELRLL
ncbi:TRAP dicarboxylate family transporter, DctP subunit (plasmid) [Ruegeria pomeroyi DSS-3]|uniref:TRAP dicarboxylate family transporter, DctP subunit n=2 Tax=Ruegeria pomeroyi TaxID=89184 RepID=Q5LL65_RUEPO|nr:TRAP transporter substrate-binding protein DctP [Ruegeria pomeroyi]AAV97298.1 TRAP dicarboxylate family transporter, DctP subunit [Ruegeria pomeroyi DSS-3]NVK96770.1 TRAP transporter substrate-binding protein DctP [Ruegeria pomeroyi]NVK99987.1 TRAP transporter substrate-binding protein DctP [Ruegeria pomeroyi]HCE70124.1 C4-dicarboxylate ABC transporter substrate-binding protein [Ruegeria sp.]